MLHVFIIGQEMVPHLPVAEIPCLPPVEDHHPGVPLESQEEDPLHLTGKVVTWLAGQYRFSFFVLNALKGCEGCFKWQGLLTCGMTVGCF